MQNYDKLIYLIIHFPHIKLLLVQHSFNISSKVHWIHMFIEKKYKWLFANSKGNKMRTTALIMSIKYVLTFLLRFQLQLP